MIYKNRDIEAVINERGVNLGNIDVVFYTKDINTTSFRLFLKQKIDYTNETFYDIFDLRNKGLTPYIDLMMEDGSIFTREPMEIVEADAGLIQYNIPSDILLHVGKVEASVYLLSDTNKEDEGVEVAQFYFYIDDNGLTSRVRRVVNAPIVDEAVARVLSQDAQKLLDSRYKTNLENSLRSYLFENADRFKGPKGDEGTIKFENLTEDEKEELKGDSGEKVNYLKVNNTNDFTAFLKISDDDIAACHYMKDSSDEFIKGYENYILSKVTKVSEKLTNANYNKVINGSMDVTTGNNHYTTKVGTTISHDFKGTYIEMNVFANSSGGMWKALIDDVEVAKISTYNSTSVIKTVTIASNLSNDNHNIKLEFIGADSEHPVTTPRGWMRCSADPNNVGATFTSKETTTVTSIEKPANFTLNFSNKEYALSVRDAEKTKNPEWFPAHNGVDTTFKGQNFVRTLIADGNVIDLNKRTPTDIYFKKAQLIQKVENRLTSDSSSRAEITFIVTFENGRAYQDIKIKWLQDSEITSGYIFQMPFLTEWFDRVVTDKFEVAVKDTVNIGVSADISNLNTRVFTGVSDKSDGKNYIYRSVIEDMTENFKEIKLARRSDSLQKLYPTVYKYTTKKAGTIDHFSGYYEFSKIPDANLVYKI